MKILFAGGGTGGHINPALAVANYIKEREPETEILYVGGADSMEARLVPAAGFEFRAIRVSGFQRKLTLKNVGRNIRAVWRVFTASAQSKKILREFAPDICMGTGGYVCGPILREAAKMGVPIVVHESNAYPGVTTKMLAKYAKCIMVGVDNKEKNRLLFETVRKYASGHEAVNFGCRPDEPYPYSYVEISVLIGLLLASGAVDFVVTGCSGGRHFTAVALSLCASALISSGIAGAPAALRKYCQGAVVGEGLAIQGGAAAGSEAKVAAWAKKNLA